MKVLRINIIICAVLGYIIGIGSFAANVIIYKEFSVAFDMILLVALSALINFFQSRVAAIVAVVYALLNFVVVVILNGSITGLPVVIFAVYALIVTFKFQIKWGAKKATLAPSK